jgi:hypothetical protein
MGNVRSGRSPPDKLGFLREEGEWPLPDWIVFRKGGANRVVETCAQQPGMVGHAQCARLAVDIRAAASQPKVIKLAAKPMNKPVLFEPFALGFHIFGARQRPHNNLDRFRQSHFEPVCHQRSGLCCPVRHSISLYRIMGAPCHLPTRGDGRRIASPGRTAVRAPPQQNLTLER